MAEVPARRKRKAPWPGSRGYPIDWPAAVDAGWDRIAEQVATLEAQSLSWDNLTVGERQHWRERSAYLLGVHDLPARIEDLERLLSHRIVQRAAAQPKLTVKEQAQMELVRELRSIVRDAAVSIAQDLATEYGDD